MINPLKITQEQFDQRWDEMPESLRGLIYSPEHAEIIRHICENQHLSEEKTETVLGIVGSVITGFLHIQDLDHKMVTVLDLNPELAKTLASEINERVLNHFDKEIEAIFQPILTTGSKNKMVDGGGVNLIGIKIIDEEPKNDEKKIKISPDNSKISTESMVASSLSDNPFIIHEEKSAAPVQDKKSILKSISIPLGFFKKKTDAQIPMKPMKVQIESPARDERRVVNYSELRTSISPFENQSFINPIKNPLSNEAATTTLGRIISNDVTPVKTPASEEKPVILPEKAAPSSEVVLKQPEQTTKPVIQERMAVRPSLISDKPVTEGVGILGTIKKTQPKVEGNLIDLKG